MSEKIVFDGVSPEDFACEGSGNCRNCELYDCYYNETVEED